MTLLQLVAMAEGFGDTAEQTVVVFRNSNGKRSGARFDVSEIRSGAVTDPVILSGDVIIAPTSAMKEAYGTFMKALPIAGLFALL
jgi:polysaccharide export outer membrane protein